MTRIRYTIALAGCATFFTCSGVFAQVVINEIMYDLSGTDTGREWVEITNTGSSPVEIATSSWKFFEANTNHGLSLFQGNTSVPTGGFAVIADNPQKFLADWPSFAGTVFDSSFSLGNSGEVLALKSDASTMVHEVTYASSAGAAGDGNSLQFSDGVWKALPPTPGAATSGGGTPSSGTNEGGSTSDLSTATTTQSTEADSGADDVAQTDSRLTSNWPVEPQVFSRITAPALAVAGADVVLKGEVADKEGKPVQNPRYLWNFGDGGTKEGESVLHAYNFPGEYVVILDASSGKWNGTSRLKIQVIPADIVIQGVVAGPEGKIELLNRTGKELNLSWWRLKSGKKFFTLPKNTLLLPRTATPLASVVTGLDVEIDNTELLYPNGRLAVRYEAPVIAPSKTFLSEAVSSETPEPTPAPAVGVSASRTDEPMGPAPTQSAVKSEPAVLQTAGVSVAFAESSNGATGTISATNDSLPRSSLWPYLVGGVLLLLGTGVVFVPRPVKPGVLPEKSEADEFTILE